MAIRGVLTKAIDQATATETLAFRVPDWARSAYIYVPTINAATFNVLESCDEAVTWGQREYDLDGTALPRAAYTGGSATIEDILWVNCAGGSLMKVVSSVAQTGLSVRVHFKG